MKEITTKDTFWVPDFESLKEFISNIPTKKNSKTIRVNSKSPLNSAKYQTGDTLLVKESFTIISVIDEQVVLYKVDSKMLPVTLEQETLNWKIKPLTKTTKLPSVSKTGFTFKSAIVMNKGLVRFKYKILKSKKVNTNAFHGYELEIIKA